MAYRVKQEKKSEALLKSAYDQMIIVSLFDLGKAWSM